jgi:CheY-like chemotaxis protein
MVGQATFFWYVRQVFDRLQDQPYLVGHPLTRLLVQSGQISSGERLRQAILQAIDQLRPPPGTPAGSSLDRRWRALSLRHVEGYSFKQIAQQIQVSERQALRDHKNGIEAVAAILWEGYCRATTGAITGTQRSASRLPKELEGELARVSALSSEQVTTDLGEALRNAFLTTRNLALTRGAEVTHSLPAGPITVPVEPSVLQQILTCLLSAVFLGGTQPRLEIRGTAQDDTINLVFSVRTGDRPSFDPGTAGDEVEALIESARRLVELCGGVLQSSDVTRFVLRFRAARPTTVLVIDDNPDLADLFQCYLAGTAYRVVPARAPSTALRLARELQPDVIILDVMLPGQDGWQLLRELAEDSQTRNIPVIACSILPERSLAVSLGVVDFLAKPVTRPALLAALDRCQRLHRGAVDPDCS